MDVNSTEYNSKDFDHFVGLLINRWKQAVEFKDEWRTLDREERFIYVEEWTINNDIVGQLEEYARSHELTDGQRVRWNQLSEYMITHKADMEKMGYRVHIPKEPKRREREVA